MAEKRIAIYETESKIIEGDYGDFYNTISRTEAIERMAKGLAKYNDPVKSGQTAEEIWNECIGEETKSFYLRQAEAALDALFKGE